MRIAIPTILIASLIALFAIAPWKTPEPEKVPIPVLNLVGVSEESSALLKRLRRVVEEHPESALAWGHFAMGLDAHDLLGEARRCYRRAAELDPKEARWPYLEALCQPEGDPARRASLLALARDRSPNSTVIRIRLGRALLDLGRGAEAQREFEKARELGGAAAHALHGLARVALASSDLSSARKRLEEAIAIAPNHRELHALLATVARRAGDSKTARLAAAKAASLPPRLTPLPDEFRREVLRRGRPKVSQARALGQRIAQMIARLDASSGQPKLARELAKVVDAALDEDPNDAWLRTVEAMVLSIIGDPSRAEGRFQELLSTHPNNAELRYRYAQALMRWNRPARALAVMRPAWEGPLHLELWNLSAWILAASKDPDRRDGEQALTLAKAVVAAPGPKRFWHYGTLAAAQAECGDFPEAIASMEVAKRLAIAAHSAGFLKAAKSRIASFQRGAALREL